MNTRRFLGLFLGLAMVVTVAVAGCFRADQPQLAGAAAVGSVPLPAGRSDVTWRRKRLSLRTLGRIMQSTSSASGQSSMVSRPLVSWAARAVLPDGVDATTDFEHLGERLFGPVIRGDRSPAGLASAGR